MKACVENGVLSISAAYKGSEPTKTFASKGSVITLSITSFIERNWYSVLIAVSLSAYLRV